MKVDLKEIRVSQLGRVAWLRVTGGIVAAAGPLQIEIANSILTYARLLFSTFQVFLSSCGELWVVCKGELESRKLIEVERRKVNRLSFRRNHVAALFTISLSTTIFELCA